MHVKLDSPAVPLAILPGLLCDGRMFQSQSAAFPDTIVIDGFYAGVRSLADMAQVALARLPRTFSLLGHSMGGRIALEILRMAPGRVARLALASTGVHPVGEGEAAGRHALLEQGRAQGMAALVEAWLMPMIAPARRADPELVGRLAAMSGSADSPSMKRRSKRS